RNAVEQHGGAPFVDAADRDDLRRAADETARARQLDGRNLTQEILRLAHRTLLHLLRREHVDGRGDLARVDGGARRRNDDARQEQRAFAERDVVGGRARGRDGHGARVRLSPNGGGEDGVAADGQRAQHILAVRTGDGDTLRRGDRGARTGDRRVRFGVGDGAANVAGLRGGNGRGAEGKRGEPSAEPTGRAKYDGHEARTKRWPGRRMCRPAEAVGRK